MPKQHRACCLIFSNETPQASGAKGKREKAKWIHFSRDDDRNRDRRADEPVSVCGFFLWVRTGRTNPGGPSRQPNPDAPDGGGSALPMEFADELSDYLPGALRPEQHHYHVEWWVHRARCACLHLHHYYQHSELHSRFGGLQEQHVPGDGDALLDELPGQTS